MGKFIDLTGQRFGRLEVLEKGENFKDKQGHNRFKWKCKCDCGNTTFVLQSSLARNLTKSCGCLQKEAVSNISKQSAKHNLSSSRLYRIWAGMKDRCTNVHSPIYKYYGKRGICICEEWGDFINFFRWAVQNGYSDSLSIDRINVNGNYSPENCRWVTQKEQTNNTRRNCFIEINKESKTIAQWSEELDINYHQLYDIYKTKDAFKNTEEVEKLLPKTRRKPVVCEGAIFPWATDCAEHYGVKTGTLVQWLNGRRKMPKIWQDRGLKYLTPKGD